MFARVNREEWATIAQHLRDTGHDVLDVRILDDRLQRYLVTRFPVLDDMDDPRLDGLFRPARPSSVLCPFYEFDATRGIFSCTIHEINPDPCRRFACDGTWQDDDRLEYCDPCWVRDGGDHASARPCEAGEGCRDVEFRVKFFIARARRAPPGSDVAAKAAELAVMIDASTRAFEAELAARGVAGAERAVHLGHMRALRAHLELLGQAMR